MDNNKAKDDLPYRILDMKPTDGDMLIGYFDNKLRYCTKQVKCNDPVKPPLVWVDGRGLKKFDPYARLEMPEQIGNMATDPNVLRKAVQELKKGNTLNDLARYYVDLIERERIDALAKKADEFEVLRSWAELRNRIVRVTKARGAARRYDIYYFDTNLKYVRTCILPNEPLPRHLEWYNSDRTTTYKPGDRPLLPIEIKGVTIKPVAWKSALKKLEISETPSRLVLLYNETLIKTRSFQYKLLPQHDPALFQRQAELVAEREAQLTQIKQEIENRKQYEKGRLKPPKPVSSITDFITKVGKPHVERDVSNKNKQTFDFIRIYLSIVSSHPDKKAFAKKHLREINRIALDRISIDRYYKTYGIPVNFLRLTECTLTKQSELMLLYELKEL